MHNSEKTPLQTSTNRLTRGALMIALALALQSLRLILPLAPSVSIFIIGTLVNMMLALTCLYNGLLPAVLLSILLPSVAYAQGQLLLPLLIPVVMAGNMVFVYLLRHIKHTALQLLLPPLLKATFMLAGAFLLSSFLHISNTSVQNALIYTMSVPQFITGVAGILAAKKIASLLRL